MDWTISATNGRAIGECIYCGCRNSLSTEHAVPFGLNGEWTLPKASCSKCADITHRFERDVMRALWPDVRNALKMRSRRPDKRSLTLPLIVQRDGIREEIQILRSEFPVYLSIPLFPPPAITWIKRPVSGVFTNVELLHVAGPTFKEASQKYPGAEFVGSRSNFSPTDFARTVAKIAFCAAVSTLGLAPFTHTPIRSVILGSDPCIGHWVGGWHGDPITETKKGLHAIKVQCNALRPEIHVFVRLFAQFDAPEYHVILGEADPAFVASDKWPWPKQVSTNS